LRKAILVVALIGASFAGGAVVNGPGLGWAQNYLTHQLGGDAPAPVDGDPAAPSIDEIPVVDDSAPGGALPAAPLPPLATAAALPTPLPTPTPISTPIPTPAPVAEEPAPIDLSAAEPPLSGPSAETAPDDVPPPPAPKDKTLDKDKVDEPESVAWKDAPDSLAPARPILPTSPNSPTAADPAVAAAGLSRAGGSDSWGEMREKLREAGVSRYWIEGEIGGGVRLRCLIPLAGQRAVGQQFEADGDSESQAAENVLRRIVLWKASETP
jgi:hypothetical protein